MAAFAVVRAFAWRTSRHTLLGATDFALSGKKIPGGIAAGDRPQPMGVHNPGSGAFAPGAV